ncbi:SDR family oxidoreductase [Leifsonia sp. NPDC056665]|uniref:SDR family oxidoreductase n=1 Tax=Leifsonia sp. NPDC056665 TaxID=3345901 RepID=UPI0036A64D6B
MTENSRPLVLVTGVGRPAAIGAGIVRRLAADGWDVAFADLEPEPGFPEALAEEAGSPGARVVGFTADLSTEDGPQDLIRRVRAELGPIRALVGSHAYSVDSGLLDTSVAAFDRHFAVNTRGSWLLIRAFAEQFESEPGSGRIVALTSDHTAHNLPYGASKGALDRIVIAAAVELAHLGITANLINPGPIDTGWMTPGLAETLAGETALGRLGRPQDTADLVAFLLSPSGGWINGQLLHSNGGFHLPV